MLTTLRVHGLDCADEATELRDALQLRQGVRELSFDLLRGLMIVEYDEPVITRDELIDAVAKIGLRAEPWSEESATDSEMPEEGRGRRSVMMMLSGLLLVLGFIVHGMEAGWTALLGASASSPSSFVHALFILSAVIGSTLVLPKAWLALRRGRLDMNVLMTVAVAGAVAIGQYSEAATVSFLFAASLALEAWSVGRAHVCGLISLGDAIRPNAKDALAAMHRAGIQRIVMLTGDNPAAAAKVALAVGIDDVRAELLPEGKVAAIEELVSRHLIVGMIGDGVNDAPAMARASLGIAMGAAGTDTALETADIALMSDDLSRVAWLITHSHRTLRIIRENIAASLGVKAVFVVLTIFGHANLWTAIAADTGVSLAVVFNALRLLRAT